MALLDEIRSFFPELFEVGLGDLIASLVRGDASASEVVAQVRESPEYKVIFPGMVDQKTGQRRFESERQYINVVNDYKDILTQFGMLEGNEAPGDFVGFMEDMVDPQELADRLTIYREVENSGQNVQDAFYVFAGLNVSMDDLYRAVVEPEFQAELSRSYDEAVAGNPWDYEKFLTRSTEVAIRHVATLAGSLRSQGLIDESTHSKILGVDPTHARNVLGAIYNGGQPGGTALTLPELQQAFQAAMLGSAATEQGLELPSIEKITELRQAGIDRAKAQQAFGSFAARKEMFSAIGQRAGVDIDQDTFTDAALLNRAGAMRDMAKAVGAERSLGRSGGGFQTQLDQGRLVQEGRRRS